jgi:hypothetical protein
VHGFGTNSAGTVSRCAIGNARRKLPKRAPDENRVLRFSSSYSTLRPYEAPSFAGAAKTRLAIRSSPAGDHRPHEKGRPDFGACLFPPPNALPISLLVPLGSAPLPQLVLRYLLSPLLYNRRHTPRSPDAVRPSSALAARKISGTAALCQARGCENGLGSLQPTRSLLAPGTCHFTRGMQGRPALGGGTEYAQHGCKKPEPATR